MYTLLYATGYIAYIPKFEKSDFESNCVTKSTTTAHVDSFKYGILKNCMPNASE